MSNNNRGLRIGNYRITPLGLGAIGLILLIIIAVVVLLVVRPFGDASRISVQPSPSPSATVEPTPVPTPSPTPEPTPRSATIRSLGEIAIQENLLEAAKNGEDYDFSEMFTYISDVMGDADYTVADVEGSLGSTVAASGSSSVLTTPASLIQNLKDAGVDMLTIANDHALDGGIDDLMAALQNCKDAGMEYIGAATSAEEKSTAKVIDINGIKVGFVAYTESLNGKEEGIDSDTLKYSINLVRVCNAKTDIEACRNAGAEVVVAYVSWGEMLNRSTTDNQKQIAKALVSAGADVIIGYNPHVIQPATWIEMKDTAGNVVQRTLCLCATGNFLSDSQQQYSDSGIIFEFTIQEKSDFTGVEITSPVYIPTYVWRIENEDSTYDYRTLAVGQWLETSPEGMRYTQTSRLKEVWAEAQSIMGTEVATVSAD